MATTLGFPAQRAVRTGRKPHWDTLAFHLDQEAAQPPGPKMTALLVLWEWGPQGHCPCHSLVAAMLMPRAVHQRQQRALPEALSSGR